MHRQAAVVWTQLAERLLLLIDPGTEDTGAAQVSLPWLHKQAWVHSAKEIWKFS